MTLTLCAMANETYVGAIMEHIEMAGIHSGDSACCTPPFSLSDAIQAQLRSIARRLALRLGVVGLLNIHSPSRTRSST